jgi:glucose/mannose-6-phosphate isomerase
MTSKLDQEKTYEKYDQTEISYGIEHLPEQLHRAWHAVQELKFPESYKGFENITLFGMGGSHLSAFVLEQITTDKRKIPFQIIHDYIVPAHIGPKSLVILSSFSGSTEEVLSVASQIKNTKAKIIVISTGGKLIDLALENKWPHFKFDPGELAAQPRLGLGFTLAGLAGIFRKLNIYPFTKKHIEEMISAMNDVIDTCALAVPTVENPAKTVAEELKGRAIIVVSAEHLRANAHILQNQINETAKQYCTFLTLPELNHHFMEGLTYPANFFSKFTVLMLRSEHYHERTQKRFDLTANVFERQGGQVIDYQARGENVMAEASEILQFGSFLSYYMGMLNEVAPENIPFVNEFKKKLN